MFYSTEILCDKKYALSTVWRAGNTAIGARTTGIRRKAVLEVSVEQTCGTIKDPPGAPIALRLQGTLLYGTARIYQEQCRYVLNDSERTQRAMAKLYNGLMDDKLDKNAGKAKSVQIVLPNDPCFDLDLFQLPPFDFDAPLDGSFVSQERQASWTNMSFQSRSSQNTQLPQLMLDADSSAGGPYGGGYRSASGASQMPDSPTPLARLDFQDEENLLLDVGLFIDENGNILEEEPRTEPQLPAFPARATKPTGDDVVPMIVDEDDDLFNINSALQTATLGSKASDGNKHSLITHTSSSPSKLSSTSSTVVSRAAHQKASRFKLNFVDGVTQIPLSDYFTYVTNYTENMERVSEKKEHARAHRRTHDINLHRKVAHAFTFGRGLFDIANSVTAHYPEHPLAQMFSGDALEESIFGEGLTRAKRRRLDPVEPSTPMPRGLRGLNMDGFDDEQEIELGRQPASALSDNPSLALRHSSVLPGSSAHGSVQQSASGIRHLPDGRLSSAGFPDSPSFFERYSDEGLDFAQHPASNGGNPFLPSISSVIPGGSVAGAGVGTDAATDKPRDSQATNNDNKVGEEVRNATVFFELVREMATNQGLARPNSASPNHRWIEFGDVVASFKQNRAAVVGAFMSLLSLTTANKLRIHQDEVEGGGVIDRDIFIGVKPKNRDGQYKGKGKAKSKSKGKKKRTIQEISSDNNSDDVDELMAEHVFSSPMRASQPFYRGGEMSGIELMGAA
ncbi:R8 protein [Sporothrix stenoceras]|uniref:R8 protein n=1 Tax=Sporothrix stenoceras TaxID=5173 RepID=A0ABR3YJ24_9PEZI